MVDKWYIHHGGVVHIYRYININIYTKYSGAQIRVVYIYIYIYNIYTLFIRSYIYVHHCERT